MKLKNFLSFWVFIISFVLSAGFTNVYEPNDGRVDPGGYHEITELDDIESSLPDIRLLENWKLQDLILVSDVDGKLHGIQRSTGAIQWTLPIEEPLIKISTYTSSNTGNDNEKSKSNVKWFVEPCNGGVLYYFTPEYGLNKVPTSIKDLVLESPFSLNRDDKIYTGSRKTSLYTLDFHTGEVKSVFGSDEECPAPNLYSNIQNFNQEGTIMIGKTTYELSIHSKGDNRIIWNVTYSEWGPNNMNADLMAQNSQSIDDLYFTIFYDKSLFAVDKKFGAPSWVTKIQLLAVNIFDVFTDSRSKDYVLLPNPLKYLNYFQSKMMKADDENMCFINQTVSGGGWFAMSFKNYPALVKSAPMSPYQMALNDLQNHNNPELAFKRLKDMRLEDISSSENADSSHLITGIHNYYELNADTMYQPFTRVELRNSDIKQIGDGKLDINELPRVPSIIDGLKFPKRQNELELAPLRNHNNYASIDKKEREVIKYSSSADGADSGLSTSLLKRVVGDFIVILVILVAFLLLRKNKILEGWNFKGSATSLREENSIPGKDENDSFIESERSITKATQAIKKEFDEKWNDLELDKRSLGSIASLKDPGIIAEGKADPCLNVTNPSDYIQPSSDGKELAKLNDSETSADLSVSSSKKKRKRGHRAGKRTNRVKSMTEDNMDIEGTGKGQEKKNTPEQLVASKLVGTIPEISGLKKYRVERNLIISDKILGYGSHGTVVYKGTFENRPVAIKRMLLDFYNIAKHEVQLLQESDDHPNVVRYFCSQLGTSDKFLYIALELCVCTLDDLVEKAKYKARLVPKGLDLKDALFQLTSGLHHLHSLQIVHRDLKPQNILVNEIKRSHKVEPTNVIRLLISDFGLCKKLEVDQSSFKATTQNSALGTSGWRAPELLLFNSSAEMLLHDISLYSRTATEKRLTKAIDIFSLGCVFYYILTGGNHPFGERYSREANIIKANYDLNFLEKVLPVNYVEAKDLISSMIDKDPKKRPDTSRIISHPFFWTSGRKLEFLLKVSDRFEVEKRDPPSELLLELEAIADKVHNRDWHRRFSEGFMENLGKYRKYDRTKVMDLLRALRNKYHHFNDMPFNLQEEMMPLPGGFYDYFANKFPYLLMEVYFVVKKNLKDEHVFKQFNL